jgi:DNA repair protein RadD
MQLRKYQQEAVDSVFAYFAKSNLPPLASPAIKLPTGSGKSLVIAAIVKRAIEEYDCRILMATHRAELIDQNRNDLLKYYPEADIGIYSASLGARNKKNRIIYCGVQSAVKRFDEFGFRDIMLIDEAHLVNAESGTQYERFISGLRRNNEDMRCVGLTATPYRQDQGLITQGKDALFNSICYSANELDLINQGYLSPLVTGKTITVDTDGIKKTSIDFNMAELDLAFNVDAVTTTVVKDIVDAFAQGRKKALVYGVSIEHCHKLKEAIRETGLIAEVITGEDSREKRKSIYEAFHDGAIHCLVSCDVLTTGFNEPAVDLIVLVRATISTALYVQILGRGMRIHPEKKDCCILDYGGNIARHGPIDQIKIKPKQKKGEGDAPTKTCKACGGDNHAAARTCQYCDAEFPAPEKKASNFASNLAPISSGKNRHTIEEPQEKWIVKDVNVMRHRKRVDDGKPPTVRIDFYGDDMMIHKIVSQWLCPEHDGFAQRNFANWWRKYAKTSVPSTCDEVILRWNEMPKILDVTTKKTENNFKEVVKMTVHQRQPGDDEIAQDAEREFSETNFDSDLPF